MYSFEINCTNNVFNMGKVLMLRGFAEFVQWKHLKNSSEIREKNIVLDIVAFVKNKNFDTIVWDGDLYRSDSFTHIIHELLLDLPSHVKFVAFKPTGSSSKFAAGDPKNCELGWSQLKQFKQNDRTINLHCINVPSGLHWHQKNTMLTREVYKCVVQNSEDLSVMYVGGGQVISHEMENLKNYIPLNYLKDKTRVYFIDIPRAAFSINKGTGLPDAIVQYIGNTRVSVDPLIYLTGFAEKTRHKQIILGYSVTENIVEYRYNAPVRNC
jgi:hypothetical protein